MLVSWSVGLYVVVGFAKSFTLQVQYVMYFPEKGLSEKTSQVTWLERKRKKKSRGYARSSSKKGQQRHKTNHQRISNLL